MPLNIFHSFFIFLPLRNFKSIFKLNTKFRGIFRSIDNMITEELELGSIKNELSYRRERTQESNPGEDDNNGEVDRIGEGGFGRIVGDVIEKHW